MDTKELEELLEAGVETPRKDFKRPCSWSKETFAKDILALSNVQDGGHVIIGMEELPDGTYVRRGVDAAQRDSFKTDLMRDEMSAFADPHVNFVVDFPKDKDGLEYAVIKVFQFIEIPVICKKESADTRRGVIYYRNTNRRVESAPVSNEYDLRAIIEMATVKMMQRKRELGFSVESSVKKKLDEELGDL